MEFDEAYREDKLPWDIGEPQPALAELVDAGWCVGTVLDAGCGTGELALAVAARGHDVLGVDVAPAAVERAERKAAERGLSATFRAADITSLTGSFDTVLDSGLLHSLPQEAQSRYVAMLGRVCRDRAAFLCFADRPGARTPNLAGLTETRLLELFASDWRIDELVPVDILGVIPDDLDEYRTWPRDDRGRTLMTGWRLRLGR